MLQGSIDTLGIAEVLRVLASTHKTGQLRLTGDRGAGSVSVADGRMVAADSAQCGSGEPLDAVVFDLLRFEHGQFVFSLDGVPAHGESHDVDDVLASAVARLDDYKQIAAVVPSLDHLVAPVDHLSQERVEITNGEWVLLRTIGDGSPVSDVARVLHLGEIDALRSVKNLVERELAIVAAPDPEAFSDDIGDNSIDVAADIPAVPGFDAPLSTNESTWTPPADNSAVEMIGDDPMSVAALSAEETAAMLDMATSVPAPAAPTPSTTPADLSGTDIAVPDAPAASEMIAEEPSPFAEAFEAVDPTPMEAAPAEPIGFRPPAPPPPPAGSPDAYQNARLEDVQVPAPDPAPVPEASPVAGFDAELPPSPSEIESFGVGVSDTAPLDDAPVSFAETPVADEAVATPAVEEAEDDHALLMRYLRAEG